MAAKIFLTGGTGYIGGSVLDTLVAHHPEWNITVLLRNPPANFSTLYPSVKVIRGDYDSTDIIAQAAGEADVVVHNGDSDHEPSICALIAGLLHRQEAGPVPPGFLIHLSGTGIVADWRTPTYHGTLNPKIWSDITDLDAITARPDGELHRNVDKIIQAAAATHGEVLKTAIVCPPDIYGKGKGPGKTQSVYFPLYVKEIKGLGKAFYAGDGGNRRSWVHIEDLMGVYLKLVEAAAKGGEGADWGKEGYYFAASQEASQRDTAKAAGRILKKHGVIESEEPMSLPSDEIKALTGGHRWDGIGTYMFAANSRTRADRAQKLFAYAPRAPNLWETMEADMVATLA